MANEKEKIEILSGDRGDKGEAAARVKHLKALADGLPTEPTGDAEADIRSLFAAINAMRVLLR